MSIYFPYHLRNSFSVGGITAIFVNGSLLKSSSFERKARAFLGMSIIIRIFFFQRVQDFRFQGFFKKKAASGGGGGDLGTTGEKTPPSVVFMGKEPLTLFFFFSFGNEDLIRKRGGSYIPPSRSTGLIYEMGKEGLLMGREKEI